MPSNASSLPAHQVFAIRYTTDRNWCRGRSFVGDEHAHESQPMDFFSWLIVTEDRLPIVVDTGMRPELAEVNQYEFYFRPSQILPELGVDPKSIEKLILSHMHFDHIGNLADFPNAQFFVQWREMSYATSRHMAVPLLRRAYTAQDTALLVNYLYEGRVDLHHEELSISPGISVHWVGGHTAGQEIVRVHTRRGWVILATDALHFYEEIERGILFSSPFSGHEMLSAHLCIRELASAEDCIIPGHDPLVMQRYPAATATLTGKVVRLD